MSDTTKLVIADSITRVPLTDWQTLTENDIYAQQGWLRSLEIAMRGAERPKYFLLYHDDVLLAAAVAYHYTRGDGVGRTEDLLFGNLAASAARLRLTPAETLYFGPLIGHGRHVFWNRRCSEPEVESRVQLLLDKILAHKDYARVTCVFGRIPQDEPQLRAILQKRHYLETQSWPISFLDIRWKNIDDYLSSLSNRGRNQSTKIRREMSAPGKKNVELKRMENFAPHAVEISQLINHTHGKHASGPSIASPAFIETLAREHGENTVATVARKPDHPEMLGFAFLFFAGENASGPLIGVTEQKLNRDAFTYFNLSFYEPVRFAIAHGIKKIYLGGGYPGMKRKRGCDELDVYVYVRPAGFLSRWFWTVWLKIHRNRIRYKAKQAVS